MFVLTLRHRVRDFDEWKKVFDERLSARQEGRVVGHRLTRGVTDPNEVEVAMFYGSLADAEAYERYMNDPHTREVLANAGVEQHAPMWIGDQLEAVTY
ncbi:MAG: hypothetical protein ACTHJM_07215 [Marmoricola sp.]